LFKIEEISATDLKRRIDSGDDLSLLDVRELEEIAIATLPSAIHIPMGDIPSSLKQLDPAREIIVICHHGVRSAQVSVYLSRMGFERVTNLQGGIDAWSLEVDPKVPRY
jgi:rhodanese-related sulfurtransferase